MNKLDQRFDSDELMALAERVAQLPEADAEWVGRLLQELLRARTREAERLAGHVGARRPAMPEGAELDEQMAQVALDTAEWLRTLWNVGYMGAGSFRSQPRSAFPAIDLEDVRKSSLFARIRQGKHVLPFPPPTRHGLPWHELLEDSENTHRVEAEIVRDEAGLPMSAIIEACSEWEVLEQSADQHEYRVQHRRKGPIYRLHLADDGRGQLRREPPQWKRDIHLSARGGLHNHTLEWPEDDGRTLYISLRAATWERAESEAEHWVATTHPEMYGQIRFVRCQD